MLLSVHYNKQRIKSFKELINEYLILDNHYRKGQGKRTDLTSAKVGKGSSREIISKEIGISSGQLQKLVYIDKHRPEHIELLDKGILTVNQSNLIRPIQPFLTNVPFLINTINDDISKGFTIRRFQSSFIKVMTYSSVP